MATVRHLNNAPIKEALIDIRVKLPQDIELQVLGSLHSRIAKDYPKRDERIKMEAKFDGKTGDVTKTVSVDGYLHRSLDGLNVVQFRRDGFTFSRLQPYQRWENLSEEANRLWRIYQDHTNPETITRVALRYINHITIPFPIRDLIDYFTSPPTVSEKLPQKLHSFLNRVVFPDPSSKAIAIVTQSHEFQGSTEAATIILDIDVFRDVTITVDNRKIWDIIASLRELKNKIFFESVTEKTLEFFN